MDYELLMNGNVKIGQKAPDFEAVTTCGNISLNDYKGKWLILFSHPGDFTPVKSESLDEYTKCLILPWIFDIDKFIKFCIQMAQKRFVECYLQKIYKYVKINVNFI